MIFDHLASVRQTKTSFHKTREGRLRLPGTTARAEAAQSSSPDAQRAGRPCSRDLSGAARRPPPPGLLLRLYALDADGAEAGVFIAKVRLKLLLFGVERLDRVHVREL